MSFMEQIKSSLYRKIHHYFLFQVVLSQTWVSDYFSAEPAHFKCKIFFQFWNIVTPE